MCQNGEEKKQTNFTSIPHIQKQKIKFKNLNALHSSKNRKQNIQKSQRSTFLHLKTEKKIQKFQCSTFPSTKKKKTKSKISTLYIPLNQKLTIKIQKSQKSQRSTFLHPTKQKKFENLNALHSPQPKTEKKNSKFQCSTFPSSKKRKKKSKSQRSTFL